MAEPNITYLNDYINDGQSALINLRKIYDTILVTEADNRNNIFRIPINDIFLKYNEQFADTIQNYALPEFYFYKPKLLSYELYGTTELWLALLRINVMRNISEFNKSIIKVYTPDQIQELIQIFFKRERKI